MIRQGWPTKHMLRAQHTRLIRRNSRVRHQTQTNLNEIQVKQAKENIAAAREVERLLHAIGIY